LPPVTDQSLPLPHPANIMVVDDTPANLKLLEDMLRQQGHEVHSFPRGRLALKETARNPPDLILLDINMPEMNGYEVCERLKSTEQGLSIPVIFLSAMSEMQDRVKAFQSGAEDYISKPFQIEEVLARVETHLSVHRLQGALKSQNEHLERTNTMLQDSNRQLQEAQMHLVQSEKMASLGQLVAGIAHEINNPLAFVVSHLYTVESLLARATAGMGTDVSEEVGGMLEKMRIRLQEMGQGLTRVKELVLSLRTFSRLDEGKLQTIDIHANIESVLLFLRHKMEGRIKLIKHYEAVAPVSCDAGQLNQVIMNLVANAIDAIPDKGEIAIATRDAPDQSIISVRDSGPGIPEAIRTRIFDPFFTTKPVGQGTGLGLAISYQIMRAHGGSIEVHSEEGQGAEFVVTIPRK